MALSDREMTIFLNIRLKNKSGESKVYRSEQRDTLSGGGVAVVSVGVAVVFSGAVVSTGGSCCGGRTDGCSVCDGCTEGCSRCGGFTAGCSVCCGAMIGCEVGGVVASVGGVVSTGGGTASAGAPVVGGASCVTGGTVATGTTGGIGTEGAGIGDAVVISSAPPESTAAYQGCRPMALIRKSTLFQITCGCRAALSDQKHGSHQQISIMDTTQKTPFLEELADCKAL